MLCSAKKCDSASLAVFRISLGLAVFYGFASALLKPNFYIYEQFIEPSLLFPYPIFEWITRPSGAVFHAIIACGAIASLSLALGMFYRVSATVTFLVYTYQFLLDSSRFNNHYYLISLLCFLFILFPSQQRFSLPNLWKKKLHPDSHNISSWPVNLLRFQLLIVYIYGAIAKINADWLTGEPIIATAQLYQEYFTGVPVLGSLSAITIGKSLAWIGLIFDAVIGFLLMIRRTQFFGMVLLACFHLGNHITLPIGVFPALAFAASTIFLNEKWPLLFLSWLKKPQFSKPDWAWFFGGGLCFPILGFSLGWKTPDTSDGEKQPKKYPLPKPIIAFLVCWAAIQTLFPLKHFLIEGDPSWTEEGQYFAWRMMLRQKAAGNFIMHINDDSIYQENTNKLKIDWNRAPKDMPQGIYISVLSERFPWDANQGVNSFYEAIIGYRMLYISRVGDFEREGKRDAFLEKALAAGYDEKLFQTTISLAEFLDTNIARLSNENHQTLRNTLKMCKALLKKRDSNDPAIFPQINTLLASGKKLEGWDIIQPDLIKLDPFALQGVAMPATTQAYYIYGTNSSNDFQQLSENLKRSPNYIIWADFQKMHSSAWETLPDFFPVYENGQLPIFVNYMKHLNSRQAKQIAIRPYMMKQCAEWVADRWYNQVGRKPKVFGYSHVMMNYRHPVALINSEIDLAATDYRLWSHNDWILPHLSEKINIAEKIEKSSK